MTGSGQVSWRTIGGESPIRWLGSDEHRDRVATRPPVVFVNGLLGAPSDFAIVP